MTSRRPGAPRSTRRPVASSGKAGPAPKRNAGATGKPRAGATSTSKNGEKAKRTAGATSKPRAGSTSKPSAGASSAPPRNRRSTSERGPSRRPQGAARPRRTPSGQDAPEGLIPGLTRRGLALIALTVLSLSALLPTVNSYVAQRQQLHDLQAQVGQQQADVEALQSEVDKWEDPTFVAAQARERLLFAMPGETQYRLTDTSGKSLPLTQEQKEAQEAARKDWYSTLWESVEGASVLRPSDVPDDAATDPDDTQDDAE